MSSNQIPDLFALDSELKSIETLKTLYLEMNPCQENDRPNYRRKIMLALPQLTQIDALYVYGICVLSTKHIVFIGIPGAHLTTECVAYI